MKFARFLAAGAVVSLLLHGAGSAYFADDPDEVSIAASEGGGVSVIGSIEDLVAGVQVQEVTETTEIEEVEPLEDTVEPVRTPIEVATPVRETPVEPVDVAAVRPIAAPVQPLLDAPPEQVAPVAEGITLAVPVTAAPLETVPPEETTAGPPPEPLQRMSEPETVAPVAAAEVTETAPVKPEKPVEIAKAVAPATPAPLEPVTPETEVAEPVPDPLLEATQTPRNKPEPPVRKTVQRKVPPKTRAAQPKGAETSSRKGGERITSATARSNANGRADAKSDDGGTRAASNYKGKVVAKLRRAKRYPREARRQKLTGIVRVAFSVSSNGTVSGIRVTRSSGHPILDRAAIEMVQRAAPMPKFPGDVRLSRMNFQVPVRFDR